MILQLAIGDRLAIHVPIDRPKHLHCIASGDYFATVASRDKSHDDWIAGTELGASWIIALAGDGAMNLMEYAGGMYFLGNDTSAVGVEILARKPMGPGQRLAAVKIHGAS